MRLLWDLLAVLLALQAARASAGVVCAQTPVEPKDVSAIARDLNCPICQGYNLQDCPLEVCAQMREEIAARLAAGQTREDIVSAFVADYGPEVLSVPPRRGFAAAAWIMPPLALLLLLVMGLRAVRPGHGGSEARSTSAAGPTVESRSGRESVTEFLRVAREDEGGPHD